MHRVLFLFLLFSIQFHHILIDYIPFYRDAISVLYFFLCLFILNKSNRTFHYSFNFLFTYLYFLFFLYFLSIFDTNYRLYGNEIKISTATSLVNEEFVVFYILRNATLYFPVILYYYLNGGSLKKEFLEKSFFTFLVFLPFSVFLFTKSVFEVELSLESFFVFGQTFIPYNTYVPYLAFPALICLYFIFYSSFRGYQFISILCFISIVFYSFISGSRQSIIFLVVMLFIFLFQSFKLKFVFLTGLFFFSIFLTINIFLDNFELNSEVLNKFIERENSITETSRIDKITYGFSLLKPYEYIVGSGISSVPDGGPHNDFVRWIQRCGIFIGLFGFIPFYILAVSSRKLLKLSKDPFYLFTFITSIFLFYTSFFGYPRDDVYQALFVFIGPIVYYGYNCNSRN